MIAGRAAGAAVQLATSCQPVSLVVLQVILGPFAGDEGVQVPEFTKPVSLIFWQVTVGPATGVEAVQLPTLIQPELLVSRHCVVTPDALIGTAAQAPTFAQALVITVWQPISKPVAESSGVSLQVPAFDHVAGVV